jgi:homocysteine S-methyltransferase
MLGISKLLSAQNGVGVVDGGFSTALEEMGANLKDSMWTARILIEQPDMVREAHKRFFESGADIAITASYKATIEFFMNHAKHLVKTPEEAL